jgi:hypothetical protein
MLYVRLVALEKENNLNVIGQGWYLCPTDISVTRVSLIETL